MVLGQTYSADFGTIRLTLVARIVVGTASIAVLAVLQPMMLVIALIPLPLMVGISGLRAMSLQTLLLVPNLTAAALSVQQGDLDAIGLCAVVAANWALLGAVPGIRVSGRDEVVPESQPDALGIEQPVEITSDRSQALSRPRELKLAKPEPPVRRQSLPAPPLTEPLPAEIDTDTYKIDTFRTTPVPPLPRRQRRAPDHRQADETQHDRWSAEDRNSARQQRGASEVLFAAYVEGMSPTKLSALGARS